MKLFAKAVWAWVKAEVLDRAGRAWERAKPIFAKAARDVWHVLREEFGFRARQPA